MFDYGIVYTRIDNHSSSLLFGIKPFLLITSVLNKREAATLRVILFL